MHDVLRNLVTLRPCVGWEIKVGGVGGIRAVHSIILRPHRETNCVETMCRKSVEYVANALPVSAVVICEEPSVVIVIVFVARVARRHICNEVLEVPIVHGGYFGLAYD